MIEQLTFYLRHSFNDLRVNGQRTFFALLCIAAGVAAIVSLQTVAVMIGDTLAGNLQSTNCGDIRVELLFGFGNDDNQSELEQGEAAGVLQAQTQSFFGQSNTSYSISPSGVTQVQTWLNETFPSQVELTYPLSVTDTLGVLTSSGTGTAINAPETGYDATSVTPLLIDAQVYPFYNEVRTLDGVLLADVLQAPTDIVVDEHVAEALEVSVGDNLRLNGANTEFTLRGIVPTEAEVTDPATGIFLALFGFYYLDSSAIQYFDTQGEITTLYLRLQDTSQIAEINRTILERYPYFDTQTTQDLQQQNEELVGQLNQLVTVMGLVSLLIGSIGIVNTMQVIVRRRTIEIAVLKTIGLQGNQITILFLVEAFLMGIVGSLMGIVLGWGTTFLIKNVAETLIAQDLPFRIALMPALNGFTVGVLVTTIFGFLPTLSAGQVRPSSVLRPNDDIVPRAGCIETLGAMVLIVMALSVVAQTILGNFALAVAVVFGAFIAAGVIYALLLFIIWLIGRFMPSFGIVDLKISLRQMLAGRTRGASTLLALVVGVFSLSLITLFAESISSVLSISLGNVGDVLITAATESSLAQIEDMLNTQEGVSNYRVVRAYSGELVSLEQSGITYTLEEIQQRVRDNTEDQRQQAIAFGAPEDVDFSEAVLNTIGSVNAFAVDQMPEETIVAGRMPTAEDIGHPVLVLRDDSNMRSLGLQVGDFITLQFTPTSPIPGISQGEPQTVRFELIGMVSMNVASGTFGSVFTTIDSIPPDLPPTSSQVYVDISDEYIPQMRRALAEIPGVFALETDVLNRLVASFLSTFTAFPTMVALLGLIVGGVVIANSVALSTMERRREIAVMKSIGLQRERVLGMLLLENGIMGLIGGLIGVGIGLVGLIVLVSLSGNLGGAIPYGTALLLMMLCVLVALIATLWSAWSASGEKPLNVLRYE